MGELVFAAESVAAAPPPNDVSRTQPVTGMPCAAAAARVRRAKQIVAANRRSFIGRGDGKARLLGAERGRLLAAATIHSQSRAVRAESSV
jgi:hypothetical protein